MRYVPHSLFLYASMIRRCFSFGVPFNYGPLGHLQTSHRIWKEILRPGDITVDATCGNGHDSLLFAKVTLPTSPSGRLYCIDVQQGAIDATRARLRAEPDLNGIVDEQVSFVHGSHETFPTCIEAGTVTLVCYNLGYLPGKQRQSEPSSEETKTVITKPETTLRSLNNALPLIREGGMITVTAYPGHPGGAEEVRAVEDFMKRLDEQVWRVYGSYPMNKAKLPVLFNAFKIDKRGKVI